MMNNEVDARKLKVGWTVFVSYYVGLTVLSPASSLISLLSRASSPTYYEWCGTGRELSAASIPHFYLLHATLIPLLLLKNRGTAIATVVVHAALIVWGANTDGFALGTLGIGAFLLLSTFRQGATPGGPVNRRQVLTALIITAAYLNAFIMLSPLVYEAIKPVSSHNAGNVLF